MRERFIQLIKDFCALSCIDNASHILDGGMVEINGIAVLLAHVEKLDPALLFVRCDFGDLPIGRKADALKALLEANLDLYEGAGPIFSLSPRTKRVIFTHSYRLDTLTPIILQEVLGALADCVVEWRSDHFLGTSRFQQGRHIAMTRALVSNDRG